MSSTYYCFPSLLCDSTDFLRSSPYESSSSLFSFCFALNYKQFSSTTTSPATYKVSFVRFLENFANCLAFSYLLKFSFSYF